jgi:hypothetical protein
MVSEENLLASKNQPVVEETVFMPADGEQTIP